MSHSRPKSSDRRHFLRQAAQFSLLAALPLPWQHLLRDHSDDPDMIIDAVDVLRVSGPVSGVSGLNRQHNSQPVHLYPSQRPAPYREPAGGTPGEWRMTHHYIRIRTRGGLEGLYGYVDPETVPPTRNQLRDFLIGQNALRIEQLWDQLYRRNRHARGGHYTMALSGIDNALWDLRGKYFNVPVYQLLGGATRDEITVYGSCLGFSVEKGAAGPKAKALFDQGFRRQKWFFAYGSGSGMEGLQHSIGLVRELREAVGYDAQLMFDAFSAWDLPFARAWAAATETYRPYWLEEPFPTERVESFRRLSRETTTPIATGEHFYNRWEVQNHLQNGGIQFVQADPEWCGGVSELVKICHLASGFGAKVFPHGHNIHAALHVVASQSPDVCPLVEYLINHMPGKVHFQKNPLLTDNGKIPLPQEPGFGIVLDDEKIDTTEVL